MSGGTNRCLYLGKACFSIRPNWATCIELLGVVTPLPMDLAALTALPTFPTLPEHHRQPFSLNTVGPMSCPAGSIHQPPGDGFESSEPCLVARLPVFALALCTYIHAGLRGCDGAG